MINTLTHKTSRVDEIIAYLFLSPHCSLFLQMRNTCFKVYKSIFVVLFSPITLVRAFESELCCSSGEQQSVGHFWSIICHHLKRKERSQNVQSEALGSRSRYAILLHNIRQVPLPCPLNSLTGRENDTSDFVLFMKSKWNNECDVSDRMSLTLSVMITYFIISLDSPLSAMVLPHLRIFKMFYIFIHFWVTSRFFGLVFLV